MATRTVKYMSPSVDFDTMPMWLPDSKHLIFKREPGLPFGQQAQQGGGGVGLPPGPALVQMQAAASTGAQAATWRKRRRTQRKRRSGGFGSFRRGG
jgi:dipeptidyl-peptidase-4